MRKWMSERLKRRKKSDKAKATEPAQPPLQPAYFEGNPAPAEPETHAAAPIESEAGLLDTPEPEEAAVASPTADVDASQRGKQRPRRRRGRGGRGRGAQRSGQAPPSAQSVPLTPSHPEPAQTLPEPAQAIPAAPPRPPKGAVILAIGLPGSGKSSWFKRNNIAPLSSDMLRLLLFDDAQEQRFQDLVFSNLRSMLKARLIARRPLNYVDATNLTPHERSGWIKLAKDYGYEVQAVFFDVPLEVCLERNRRRDRFVDEDVMRRMAAKLKAPTFQEGFSKVTVVRVKKKESEAAS
jgi:predicted kinase